MTDDRTKARSLGARAAAQGLLITRWPGDVEERYLVVKPDPDAPGLATIEDQAPGVGLTADAVEATILYYEGREGADEAGIVGDG